VYPSLSSTDSTWMNTDMHQSVRPASNLIDLHRRYVNRRTPTVATCSGSVPCTHTILCYKISPNPQGATCNLPTRPSGLRYTALSLALPTVKSLQHHVTPTLRPTFNIPASYTMQLSCQLSTHKARHAHCPRFPNTTTRVSPRAESQHAPICQHTSMAIKVRSLYCSGLGKQLSPRTNKRPNAVPAIRRTMDVEKKRLHWMSSLRPTTGFLIAAASLMCETRSSCC
jgi:hypothetical protein